MDALYSEGVSLYLRAFADLMHDRQYDWLGHPMPIPYLALAQYGADQGIPPDEFPVFRQMVRALDDEWRTHVIKKTPAKPPAQS